MTPSILITGGTGLIGARLAEKLLARGKAVVLFDMAPSLQRVEHLRASAGERMKIVRGDITSLAEMIDATKQHGVGAIVHLAALLGSESGNFPELATRVNVVGTTNVLETARLLGVERILIASSVAVYGADSDYDVEVLPLRENAPLHIAAGLRVYGATKLYCEHIAKHYADEYGMTTGGLRLSTVYGSGRQRGSATFVSGLVDCAVQGQPVSVDLGDAVVNVVYVDDVAAQFAALLDARVEVFREHRFFNTGGDRCTVREFAATVGSLVPGARITVLDSDQKTLAGMAATVSDDLLVQTVGVRREFTPLTVGLKAFIDAARAATQTTCS